MASLRFPFAKKELTSTEKFNYMSDADPKKREESAKSIGKVLKKILIFLQQYQIL